MANSLRVGVKPQKIFSHMEVRLLVILRFMMFLSGFGLAALMFAQVVLRSLNSPFLGFEELSVLLGLWCYFTGMAHATRSRNHITGGIVDLLVKSKKIKTWLQIIVDVLCTMTIIFFTVYAMSYFLFVAGSGRVSVAMEWPRVLWVASMIFGFTLTVLYFAMRVAQDFVALKMLNADRGSV